MKTKSGKYLVFHRDRCPFAKEGAPVPKPFAESKGPFFFMLTEGEGMVADPIVKLTGYPYQYSFGYNSEDEALHAAEEWDQKGYVCPPT